MPQRRQESGYPEPIDSRVALSLLAASTAVKQFEPTTKTIRKTLPTFPTLLTDAKSWLFVGSFGRAVRTGWIAQERFQFQFFADTKKRDHAETSQDHFDRIF